MPSKLIFQDSWLMLLACGLAALALSVLLYAKLRRAKDIKKFTLYTLASARFLSSFFIALLLLSILLRRYQNNTEKPVILLAVDNSASILANADSSARRAAILKAVQDLGSDIENKYSIAYLPFGSETGLGINNVQFNDKESDFENLFNDIDNNYANQNIGALVLLSDGIYNKGANPENNLTNVKFPIYTIGIGDTTEYPDLMIQKVEHNEVAYVGDQFLVEVLVSSKKILNQATVVSIVHNQKTIQSQALVIGRDPQLSTLTFTLNADVKGLQAYSAQITVLPGEKNKTNNHFDFTLDVIDNKEKIAMVSHAPHPDLAAIKESLESKSNYSLACFNDMPFSGSVKSYALVIVEGFRQSDVALLNDCKNAGVPVWLVNPETADNLPGVKLNVSPSRFNETENYVNDNFNLFSFDAELKTFIKDAPALKTFFGNYTALNATEVMIKQKIGQIDTENPVLIFSEYNGSKCACFIGDGLWRWKMRNFADKGDHKLFNALVGKVVQYLAVKKDKSFFRFRTPNKINENETLYLEAELYNQSYEAVNDAEVNVKITDASQHEFRYVMSKTNLAYGLNVGMLKPGDYLYQADVSYNNQLYTKQGKIHVNAVESEKMNTVANFNLLRTLSKATNGEFYPFEAMKALKERILANEQIKSITYSDIEENYLIDLSWLFVLIVVFLGFEWFLRKQYLHI